ncbi:hypothetical protein GGU10DRAFT_421652 [Lentinula aff. detonsa]|uniref:F-box domain-containing protein n=1 Tax=Lentinula aff. detonsa TaxID=2804958 RepID=A0AA38U6P1_9AGAR|nr:hypothetical protein GGU10DRAFT_421652 [Lentinula aff. detonsa]
MALISPELNESLPEPNAHWTVRGPADTQKLDGMLQTVKGYKDSILAELSALEEKKAIYQRRLLTVQDRERRIRFHQSTFSTVPEEVLTLIFEEICLENSFKERKRTYAIVLCGVCRVWRRIVSSRGKCWSTFHVCGTTFYKKMREQKQRDNLRNLTKMFLGYAVTSTRKLPLSLHIECTTIPSSTMSLLLKEVSRWEVVKLVGTHDDFNSLDSRMTIFPILRSLTICNSSDRPLEDLVQQFDNFSSIPIGVLRNLCLWQRLLRRDSLTGHWDHLTRLELHDTSSENIIDTLRGCGSVLQTVTLTNIAASQRGGIISSSTVTLVALRELTISLGSTRDDLRSRDLAQCLLNRLTLPGLTSLKVSANGQETLYDNHWVAPDVVEDFFCRSNFPLQELSLSELGISDTQLKSLLDHINQTLKVLSITETTSGTPGSRHSRSLGASLSMSSIASTSSSSLECEVVETLSTVFLQELNPDRPSSSGFLPVLTELNLTRNSGLKFDRRAFLDVVCSRSPDILRLGGKAGVVPLEKISLRIGIPRRSSEATREHAIDPFDFAVYGALKRDLRVCINDNDPEGKYEMKSRDVIDESVLNDVVDMSSGEYLD